MAGKRIGGRGAVGRHESSLVPVSGRDPGVHRARPQPSAIALTGRPPRVRLPTGGR